MDQDLIDNLGRQAIKAALLAGIAIMDIYNNENFQIEYKADDSPITIADKKAHYIISGELTVTKIPILSEEGADIPYELRKSWNLFWLVDPIDGTKEFIKRNGEFTVNIALIENDKPVFAVIYSPVNNTIYFGSGNSAYSYGNIDTDQKDMEATLTRIDNYKQKLPLPQNRKTLNIAASRSNLSKETEGYIQSLKAEFQNIEVVKIGSSLKFCLIAEGIADIYPRFSPTMEWDTAAGHAIVVSAGGSVVKSSDNKVLEYNKENLENPWFIVKNNLIT